MSVNNRKENFMNNPMIHIAVICMQKTAVPAAKVLVKMTGKS